MVCHSSVRVVIRTCFDLSPEINTCGHVICGMHLNICIMKKLLHCMQPTAVAKVQPCSVVIAVIPVDQLYS